MAVATFSISKLMSESGIKEIAESIDLLGMSVESIEGDEIKVDVTPNRPDLLDFFGMARAIAYFSGKRDPDSGNYQKVFPSGRSITVSENVRDTMPFIAGLIAEWVDLSGDKLKSLINFTEKLSDTYGRHRRKLSIGLHNLDAIDGNLTYGLLAIRQDDMLSFCYISEFCPLFALENILKGELVARFERCHHSVFLYPICEIPVYCIKVMKAY